MRLRESGSSGRNSSSVPSNALRLLSILGAVENFGLDEEMGDLGAKAEKEGIAIKPAAKKTAVDDLLSSAGYLRKQGPRGGAWHQRYFELCGDFLFYKHDKSATEAVGVLPLSYLGSEGLQDYRYLDARLKNDCIFEIYDPCGALLVSAKERAGNIHRGLHQVFLCEAESAKVAAQWVALIRKNIASIRNRAREEAGVVTAGAASGTGEVLSLPVAGMSLEGAKLLANELEVHIHKC